MKLLINEIFLSEQGEGPSAGKPSIFVRLGGCNLACSWCDTKYTWDPAISDNRIARLDDVVQEIKKYDCKHLVITGGEPMLQQDKIEVILEALPDYTAEIETNGSIECTVNVNQINCSPKLANSGNKPYQLKVGANEKRAIWKYVIQSPADLEEVEQHIQENQLPKERIYLMPEGTTKKVIEERSKWLIDACKKAGYNFTTRHHILKFNGERGK